MLAEKLVEMFKQELVLKRLLVFELLARSCPENEQSHQLCWEDELYHGEADDLNMCNLYLKDTAEAFHPKISGWKSKISNVESEKNPNHDVLQFVLNRLTTRSLDDTELNQVKAESNHDMKKSLTWWDLTWFGIGAVIGAGIFVLTGQEANEDAGPTVILSFAVSGVSAMLSVLCYT
ncbi:cationic amino acid transporter 8, vacuolar-like isoform X2 [Spinacia oleracea]|uniref:Cationic amino acid transporter 8, vacuolar-like isoform X2 n=1 Tax=Spinacia oleracea TaxID=3562 RepID=A0A9R0KAH4_SPIOL|nr:cationic amino acid transporter 8, vacuolar-like isoform X2 [Spinacia oleracea]XP_056686656.1 cationic amino acid transporter 8, vacuolar-like isoform X2 [Spinacia oleracea]